MSTTLQLASKTLQKCQQLCWYVHFLSITIHIGINLYKKYILLGIKFMPHKSYWESFLLKFHALLHRDIPWYVVNKQHIQNNKETVIYCKKKFPDKE